MKNVTVIAHPLVQHSLAQLRDRQTQPQEFRRLLGEIAALMIYEATRNFSVKKFPLKPRSHAQMDFNSNAKSCSSPFCAPDSGCWIPFCN
jgi:uracil phosphoribosyltransferase